MKFKQLQALKKRAYRAFAAAKKYRDDHGDLLVPVRYHDRSGFALGEWIVYNRQRYISGNLTRAAVSLAQDWRSDKIMHKLEALLIVANKEELLIVSGTGEVIDPDDGWTLRSATGCRTAHSEHTIAITADGAEVLVESAIGSLRARLKLDALQRRDVVLVPKGGHFDAGTCANALVKARLTDAGEGAAYLDCRVRIRQA